ncbi:MAG TPA: PepSY domain-containing protein, partial [Burkholderiaceae bacterium]|nr:PepSY domain-containing protein [Burkholderiaceae bacterium]
SSTVSEPREVAGVVLPLRTLVERLAREHPGEVLEVELEREDGRWVYEIKLLQPGGRLVKLEVDAATGQVLRLRERSRRSEARR